MNWLKKYIDKDIIFTLFFNLFVANLWPHGFFLGFLFIMELPDDNIFFTICIYSMLFLAFLRTLCLPILYKYLENSSKNEMIQCFISNLKNDNKFRIKLLFIIEFLNIILLLASDIYKLPYLICILLVVLFFLIVLQMFIFPLLYKDVEKNKAHKYVYKFIYNLKNNSDFRFIFLYLFELFLFIYLLIIWLKFSISSFMLDYMRIFLLTIVFFDLFGSYLVLFLWWKLRGELKNIDK